MVKYIYPIPFFVVDRPMSLELLNFCEISQLPFKVGIMSHVNVSKNFKILFKKFKGNNVIKIVDSGMFSKNGCNYRYNDLFEIYENMGAEYGIMIDILKDKYRTIESAKKAIKIYNNSEYNFKLIGVAQGNTLEDYLECYEKLKKLGFKYIAMGGLLKKIDNSCRYVRVRDIQLFENILKEIRNKYPKDWLFLLGCYHPNRVDLFRKYNIFGADYKGWILNYRPPTEEEKKIKSKEELRRERFIQIRRYLYDAVFSKYISQEKKLILISCSKKKKFTKGKIPAIELYDGPFFKLLRKYNEILNLDVYIILAKYGLIKSSDRIEFYDMKMNAKRAKELKEEITQALTAIFEKNQYSEIMINLGKNYLRVLDGFIEKLICNEKNYKVLIAEGKIGERLHIMKKWLESFKVGD